MIRSAAVQMDWALRLFRLYDSTNVQANDCVSVQPGVIVKVKPESD
jgi:hypothetical protein